MSGPGPLGSGPPLTPGVGGSVPLCFPEPAQETKPLTCDLCTFITDCPRAFERHCRVHGEGSPCRPADVSAEPPSPPAVKQEPPAAGAGTEWWPHYEAGEPPALPCQGGEALGARGPYGWDFRREAGDGGGPFERHWGPAEGGGRGSTNGQPEPGAEPAVNYKVVVVGEERGRGGRPSLHEAQDSLSAEDELTAQQREHFSTVYDHGYEGELEADGEPAALSGESSPGSRPPRGAGSIAATAAAAKHKWQSKQYQCDLCPYVARGKQDLRIHEREQHLKEGHDVIKCNQCNYTTNKISFWRQHKLVHISANGSTGRIYMCKTCGWKTKYRHSLVKHIALHTGNKSFQCDQCGFACARKENLKRHKLTHLKKGVDGKGLMLKCDWCEYATAHSNALRRHAMTLHNADENYIPEYRCDVCEFKTTKLSNFSNHKITHLYAGYMMMHVNQTGPLKCSLCPFVTDHWDCLQEHQRTHKELRCIQDMLGGGEAERDPTLPPPLPPPHASSDNEAEGGQEPFALGAAGPEEEEDEEEEEEEQEEEEIEGPAGGFGVPDPRPDEDDDDDIVALRKIIGTIGEYVNGGESGGEERRVAGESEIEYCGTSYRGGPAGGRTPGWEPLPPLQHNAKGVPAPGRRPAPAAGGWRKRRRPGSGVPLACPTCGWEAGSRQSLSQHIARHGLTKRFKCPHCRFACYKKERLRRHVLTHGAKRLEHSGPGGVGGGPLAHRDSPRPGSERTREVNAPSTPGASSPRLSEQQEISEPPPQLTCLVAEPGVSGEGALSLERQRLALDQERFELEKEKWRIQRGLFALQERKLQLQVLLLERQLNLGKNQPQT